MMADQISEEDIRKLLAEMRANSPTGGALGQVSDFDPPPLSLGNDRTTSIYDEYLNQEGLESVGADTPREYESGQPVPPMTPEELKTGYGNRNLNSDMVAKLLENLRLNASV